MDTTVMLQSPSYGNFTFDAVLQTEHSYSVVVTEHPVMYGSEIADHAYDEPDEVSLKIGMTDVAEGGAGRSVNAFLQLRELMLAHEPLRLLTRLRVYDNMVITSMSVPDDYKTMHALQASISLRQVRTVPVSIITITYQAASKKRSSPVVDDDVEDDRSAYKQILDYGDTVKSQTNATNWWGGIGGFLTSVFSGGG